MHLSVQLPSLFWVKPLRVIPPVLCTYWPSLIIFSILKLPTVKDRIKMQQKDLKIFLMNFVLHFQGFRKQHATFEVFRKNKSIHLLSIYPPFSYICLDLKIRLLFFPAPGRPSFARSIVFSRPLLFHEGEIYNDGLLLCQRDFYSPKIQTRISRVCVYFITWLREREKK